MGSRVRRFHNKILHVFQSNVIWYSGVNRIHPCAIREGTGRDETGLDIFGRKTNEDGTAKKKKNYVLIVPSRRYDQHRSVKKTIEMA